MGWLKLRVRVAAAWAILVIAAPAQAAEWFVAPGGSGNGSAADPFGRVQDGLNAANPGDIITVLPGTYSGAVQTVRSGTAAARITLRAQSSRQATLTAPGRVVRVDHAYITVEGLVIDGQYGAADTVDVNSGAHFLTLRNLE